MAKFSKESAKRIGKITRRVEDHPRNTPARSKGPREVIGGYQGGRWFYTTSAITIASVTGTGVASAVLTYGSGSARICNGTMPGAVPDADAEDTTIFNGLNGTIPINRFVFCIRDDEGKWIINIAWCG